ncbi:MAG TPA: nitrate- and nitrite sensing domain-containing protein [Streptosporangiaceae bacterium]
MLAPRNWRVPARLIVLVAIPAVLGLALTGLRITDTARSATAYGQVVRLAALGRQVTGLAQALEDERAAVAAFIAQGRPAAGRPALQRQYAITDRWAATVRRLVPQLDHGYPAQTRAGAAAALASVADLPGLRRHAAQPQVPALAVVNGYSAATAGLFAVNDGIADLSGNAALITSVRALGSLSRMKDQASEQQAILGAALAQGHFDLGALTALTSAQARQASDLAAFRGSATSEQSWALTTTLAAREAGQAQAVEQRAIAAGDGPLAFGAQASQQWRAGMSYTVGWMRHAEQQLTDWITSYAQGLQRTALRSALLTGGVALAALALVLAFALLVARSIVRPLRRLEAAARDVAGARLPAAARSLDVAGNPDHPVPVTPIDVSSRNEVGQVARAVDQVHREAVQLAAEQAWQRASASALSARFFRRSYALQERLLRLIDSLELSEDDPERLASLFQMDHLVTRMRRDSDSALVLIGDETQRDPAGPFSLVDVIRAAVSEVEQYDRVTLDVQQGVLISGNAAADTVHLLAELLENATTFSAGTTPVNVCGQRVRDGRCLISIADGGGAMSQDQLRQINWQLAHPAPADAVFPQHVGLSAVAHLAARHGIDVMLKMPPDGGTTAEVHVPASLISQHAMPGGRLRQAGGIPLDVPFSAVRFAAGPMPPREPPTVMPPGEPRTVIREAVPLSAPVPSADPAGSYADYADQETGEAPDRRAERGTGIG